MDPVTGSAEACALSFDDAINLARTSNDAAERTAREIVMLVGVQPALELMRALQEEVSARTVVVMLKPGERLIERDGSTWVQRRRSSGGYIEREVVIPDSEGMPAQRVVPVRNGLERAFAEMALGR